MEVSETIGLHWTIYGTDRHASGTQIGALELNPAKVLHRCGALGGIRTPNLLIRSQMLYPLGYERRFQRSDQRFCPRWAPTSLAQSPNRV